MKYAKKFKNKNDYNVYMKGGKAVLPNVSYVVATEEIKFNEKPRYITMTASDVQSVLAPSASPIEKVFEYSYDAKNWVSMKDAVEFGTSGKETIYIRGKNPNGIRASFTLGNETSLVDLGGNCMSLIDWETLPTTLPSYGFSRLFYNCKAIRSVSNDFFPAKAVENNSCSYMFAGCTSLIKAPELPARILGKWCYNVMFKDCTSLVTPPNLPSTTLADACYSNMFQDCISLSTAPKLSATELMMRCYLLMFRGCTNLKKAPELPAKTLVSTCYLNMFSGCSSLNEIHCDATDISATDCTKGWLSGVASAGTFYGDAGCNWEIDSPNGVPVGWTHANNHSVQMTASAAQTVKGPSICFEYSYNGRIWNTLSSPAEFGVKGKETIYIRGKNNGGIGAPFVFGNTSAKVSVKGNAMSLIDWETLPIEVPEDGLCYLFSGATALQSVSNNFLPASILGYGCYAGMFQGCTSLVNAPALPAAASRPQCYSYMFDGCTNLNEIHCDATDITESRCVEGWLNGVASSGDFYGKTTANWPDGPSGIPNGWTKHLS